MTAAYSPKPMRQLTLGRRMYRGIVFGLLVALVGAGMAVIPGLFVQSIFIGNAQRCEEQQQLDIATTGEIQTTCEQDLEEAPGWMPAAVIAGGGTVGLLGGFGYGFISPSGVPSKREEREQAWLPF